MSEARIFTCAIGALYVFAYLSGHYGLFIQDLSDRPAPFEVMQKMELVLRQYYLDLITYTPSLCFIGVGYMLFGAFLHKLETVRMYMLLTLSAASLAWFIWIATTLFPQYFSLFTSVGDDLEIPRAAMIGGLCGLVLLITGLFTVPQLYIARMLIKLKNTQPAAHTDTPLA
jgi:hypothetical protein